MKKLHDLSGNGLARKQSAVQHLCFFSPHILLNNDFANPNKFQH